MNTKNQNGITFQNVCKRCLSRKGYKEYYGYCEKCFAENYADKFPINPAR